MVFFTPDTHKYSLIEDPKYEFTSVSRLLELVKQPFDKKFWSEKKAKERGVPVEEILKEWDEKRELSLEKGTRYHEEYEKKLLEGKHTHPSIEIDGVKHAHDLSELKAGVHPELLLYNLRYGVCGTADIVEINEDKTFNILDHKTNAKLEFNSFKKFDPIYKERVSVKMLSPLTHLEDCNGIHYSLQLSLYAWMLEQFGYKCNSLTINHVIFEDNEPCNIIPYPVEYLKKEVINLLTWFKEKK